MEYIFEYTYLNHAWGYNYRGYLFLQDGSVLSYGSDKTSFPDDSDLQTRLAQSKKVCNIRKDKIESVCNNAKNILAVELRRTGGAFDAGTSKFILHKKQPNNSYKSILLETNGDNEQKSLDKNVLYVVNEIKKMKKATDNYSNEIRKIQETKNSNTNYKSHTSF